MKKLKRIGAMICAIALCFCMVAPASHAQGLLGGQQFGAWMAAGLYATSILLNSLNVAVPGHFNEVCQWINAPTKVEEGTFFDYNWPEPTESLSEYLNRSIIKVNQGVTTIDGVEYDELWISPDGAGKVKANAFDFKTKWNILSNNVGTLAEGYGYVCGDVPVYSFPDTNYVYTQLYEIPFTRTAASYQFGDMTIDITPNTKRDTNYQGFDTTFHNPDGTTTTKTGWMRLYNNRTNGMYYRHDKTSPAKNSVVIGSSASNATYPPGDWIYSDNSGTVDNPVMQEFSIDYTSGIVPASDADIPDDYGISMMIPHDKLETFYNTYPQYDSQQATINIEEDHVDIDELTQSIFDMIDSLDEIKAEWTNGEEPKPPVPVDPIENINQNVEDISQYQADMQQQVDHMHQDVESIHQTQQAQQQTQQDIAETSESIDSTLKEVKDAVKPGEVTPKQFDLRRLFPFCIPFDIHNMLQKFDAEPRAPHVQIPFVIESIGFNYTIDLDFSAFDGIAQTLRTLELIVYCLGLAWATSKVIKW